MTRSELVRKGSVALVEHPQAIALVSIGHALDESLDEDPDSRSSQCQGHGDKITHDGSLVFRYEKLSACNIL